MNVQVTSVSKREQKISTAGAAIYVITQEDIRRSGATNIPDLLRMVPGVNVARVDHSDWAVSIRGFSAVYANKVLVLVDGRSVYHPVFSGVLWYALDVPLENIERIEVIRGPGGNGVGRECHEWGDQHHHEKLEGHAWGPNDRRRGNGRAGRRIGSVWRQSW
jgi:iron complex outermembrane receptor protein